MDSDIEEETTTAGVLATTDGYADVVGWTPGLESTPGSVLSLTCHVIPDGTSTS